MVTRLECHRHRPQMPKPPQSQPVHCSSLQTSAAELAAEVRIRQHPLRQITSSLRQAQTALARRDAMAPTVRSIGPSTVISGGQSRHLVTRVWARRSIQRLPRVGTLQQALRGVRQATTRWLLNYACSASRSVCHDDRVSSGGCRPSEI